jgi:hypothetical protein
LILRLDDRGEWCVLNINVRVRQIAITELYSVGITKDIGTVACTGPRRLRRRCSNSFQPVYLGGHVIHVVGNEV